MKWLIFAILLVGGISAAAQVAATSKEQFAIVNDSDGYVYVRATPTQGNNITDTLYNGTMVFVLKHEGNWLDCTYGNSENLLGNTGFVYKNRLQLLGNFQPVKMRSITDSSATFQTDSLMVKVTLKAFNPDSSTITYFKGRTISQINGKRALGTDGEMPKQTYESIFCQIGSRKVNVPYSGIADLFEPALWKTNVTYDKQKDTLYIWAYNSDGAGGYYVLWVIEGGVYTRRYLVYDF